jgi:hypothetical protein
MGSFLGSVQVRSDDRERVIQAAEEVARVQRQTCLVGPVLDGWIGIYPEQGGQDGSFAQAVAAIVAEDVLHLSVHDDDITAYWWWREGKLLDAYWSTPGYFGEEHRTSEEARAGQPELLAQFAVGKAEELRQILARDKPKVLEGERLRALSSALGIRNTLTSFEYLKGGERRGITGWRKFVEVPRDEAARARGESRRKKQKISALIKGMKGSGLLLVREVCKLGILREARAGNGFIVGYFALGKNPPTPPKLYREPWESIEDLSIATEASAMSIASDRNGDRVAIAFGKSFAVWNVAGWQKVVEIPEDDWGHRVALSPDGSLLACTLRGRTKLFEVDSGRCLATLSGQATLLAFHPSNRWLVTSTELGLLCLTDLSVDPPTPRLLFVGGQYPEPSWVADARVQSWNRLRSENQDAARVEAELRAAIEQVQATVKQARPDINEQELAKLRAEAEDHAKGFLAMIKHGPPARPAHGNERAMAIGFHSDGMRFWCGTDQGLRVYAWRDVLAADGKDMPDPALAYRPTPVADAVNKGYVYAVAEEPGGDSLLFGGLNGRLYRIDLRSGQVRELLTMPEEHEAIHAIILSSDTVGIASSIVGPLHGRNRDDRTFWSVLSYERLRARAMTD